MKKLFFTFFRNTKLVKRKYYATGLGTYFLNVIFKRLLFLYKGDFLLHFTSRINSPQNLKIVDWDNNSSVHLSLATSFGCYYQAINGIEFGKNTIWAPNVMFISSNHDYKSLQKNVKAKPIVIGNDVWIGSNSVILPKTNIGDFSIVGAGAVVTKSFPSHSIIAGNPARIIAKRCTTCLDKIGVNESKCLLCGNL